MCSLCSVGFNALLFEDILCFHSIAVIHKIIFKHWVIIFIRWPLSILSLFTSFSILLYLFSCCSGRILTGYSGDNDQTSQLPHPHMYGPIHTHMSKTKTEPNPKDKFVPAGARRHAAAKVERCQLKTYTLNTHTHTQS